MNSRAYLQSLSTVPDAGALAWLNKRKSPRVQYCARLPINANDAHDLTRNSQFESVETRDLSQSGVSFYCADAPPEPSLIVQLGDRAAPLYMLARIVRCEKDYNDPERRFIVGCEFLGQLKAGKV